MIILQFFEHSAIISLILNIVWQQQLVGKESLSLGTSIISSLEINLFFPFVKCFSILESLAKFDIFYSFASFLGLV